jgi:preprotein translocase subunit SecF
MKKNKVIVDRKKLSSEEVKKHQDFENVLNSSLTSIKPFWKKMWFYGPVGIASIGLAFTLGVVALSSENEGIKKVGGAVVEIDLNTLEDTECIHKPVKELAVDYNVFSFKNEEGGTFVLESGTKITIPENSIIDKKRTFKIKGQRNEH